LRHVAARDERPAFFADTAFVDPDVSPPLSLPCGRVALNPIRSADSPPALLLAASLVDPAWLGSDRLAQAARAPGFAALARRAAIGTSSGGSPTHLPDPGHEDWLQKAFGLPPGAPIAACSALADGAFQACWRLDPVNLHIGRDHLVLTDPARLALGADDARALAASIAELFQEEGLTLIAAHPSRWYLQETEPARGLRLQTRSMLAALGRSIDGWQPTGNDARRWRRIVNEVQMSWYRHPVNEQRESQGLTPVNSLWIEGPCPGLSAQGSGAQITDQIAGQIAAQTTSQIASCGVAAGRIAARRSASVSAAGADPGSLNIDMSEPCIEASMALTIDDRLFEAQCAGDPQRWMQAWQSLDETYFGPMSRAQAPWQRGATLVLAGDGLWRELVIGAKRPWRFWQHRPTPDALLSGGAAR
jgi:hypothetical protein